MSECNPTVINWAGRAKQAGLSFLIVNLGVPRTLPINQCSRGIILNVCCSSSSEGNCHTDHQWTEGRANNSTRICTLVSDTDTHTPGMTLPRTAWIRLNCFHTSVGCFPSCLYQWVWPRIRPMSVAQKNKPSTMLSSNVQSIDLLMECMAWRFWKMRQWNGCSPAPRFSAV